MLPNVFEYCAMLRREGHEAGDMQRSRKTEQPFRLNVVRDRDLLNISLIRAKCCKSSTKFRDRAWPHEHAQHVWHGVRKCLREDMRCKCSDRQERSENETTQRHTHATELGSH